jgi:hypothetical protein
MGISASSTAINDAATKLRELDSHRLRDKLQAAFDDFVVEHCEVSPEVHVKESEMQSAIVVYMMIAGFSNELTQWTESRSCHRLLFDDFGKGLGVEVSGIFTHRVLAGILVRSWPRNRKLKAAATTSPAISA